MKGKQGQKSSLSFLQRFQGKKSTVTKQGIQHLFDQQLKRFVEKKDKKNDSSDNQTFSSQALTKLYGKSKSKDQFLRSGSETKCEKINAPSSRLSYRTQILRNDEPGQNAKKDGFTLPKIDSRFNNSHNLLSDLRKDNEPRKKAIPIQIKPKKIAYLSKNLDVNALQHLQFLNRLQQKLTFLKGKS